MSKYTLIDADDLELRNRAEAGEVDALYNLAVRLGYGRGVPLDEQKALPLFLQVYERRDELSDRQNIPYLLCFLGRLHEQFGDPQSAENYYRELFGEVSRLPMNEWPFEVLESVLYFGRLKYLPETVGRY